MYNSVLDQYGYTALICAILVGNNDIVRARINAGSDLDYADKKVGKTALMWAILFNSPEIVYTLIEFGADLNHANNKGFTALRAAAIRDFPDMVQALNEAGAEVNCVDNEGKTALMGAIALHRYDIARALIEAGAKVDQQILNAVMIKQIIATKREAIQQCLDSHDMSALKEHLELLKSCHPLFIQQCIEDFNLYEKIATLSHQIKKSWSYQLLQYLSGYPWIVRIAKAFLGWDIGADYQKEQGVLKAIDTCLSMLRSDPSEQATAADFLNLQQVGGGEIITERSLSSPPPSPSL